MLSKNFYIKNKILKWLLYIVAIFFILGIIFYLSFYLFEKKYNNKIYPGIKIGEINLGGLTKEEAKKELNKKINKINEEGIKFIYNDKKIIIKPTISSFNPELAYEIIHFNSESTIDRIYKINRKENYYLNIINKIIYLAGGDEEKIDLNMNESEIKKILYSNFETYNNPAVDAKLIIATSTDSEIINFSIENEKIGKIIDFEKSIKNLGINLLRLNNYDIILNSITDYPKIHKKEILNIKTKANKILALAPLSLNYEKRNWKINKDILLDWLILEKIDKKNDSVIVNLKEEKIAKYLKNTIAPNIDKKAINGKFRKENNKVVEFRASTNGKILDIEKNLEIIKKSINENLNEINLIVDVLKSAYGTEEINNIGIKELIGTGYSNFAGSPANRIHNIKTGAASINGLLIEPGEEFSLVKALGEIDASSGYLPELVIKGNETIPEYGGGLCQIATTLFRAATGSGLPITARRNHSYRVSYYEPAGTDASVYDPWPDLRFKNDTKNHLLIQSRIEGNNIYFNFWGTNDGRVSSKTKPTIYNIVKPNPTKIVETIDLPVGEKKCTESAHNGADAYFDYTVTYSNGEIKEKRFNSHYIPWQEVCLIGVEELSEETATSTEDTIIR